MAVHEEEECLLNIAPLIEIDQGLYDWMDRNPALASAVRGISATIGIPQEFVAKSIVLYRQWVS